MRCINLLQYVSVSLVVSLQRLDYMHDYTVGFSPVVSLQRFDYTDGFSPVASSSKVPALTTWNIKI